jgi:hypothetical protein
MKFVINSVVASPFNGGAASKQEAFQHYNINDELR